MFEEDDPKVPRCPACGFRTNFLSHNPLYRQPRKRKSDFLVTYDGSKIVTHVFRDFCLSEGYKGIRLPEFRNDPDHFHLLVDDVVKFDAKRRETRFIDFCPVCENYDEVIGADPAYLIRKTPLNDGIYRTDLLFAGGDRKRPVIIIAPETKRKMEAANLKGLIVEPAYGSE